MINFDAGSWGTRYFVWCCDHLPLTVGIERQNGAAPKDRCGVYYIENGTTLCHFFWVTFWMPIILIIIAAAVVFALIILHLSTHIDLGARMGVAAYFMPEFMLMAIVAAVGAAVLIILGAARTSFWTYLKSIKQRICPLVAFNNGGRR